MSVVRPVLLTLLAACAPPDASDHDGDAARKGGGKGAPGVVGLEERPVAPDCTFTSGPTSDVHLVRAWPDVLFNQPTDLERRPDTTDWWVLERVGRIFAFDGEADVPTATKVLDITDRVFTEPGSDTGLVGIAFHPDFALNREVYLSYGAMGGTTHLSRVSRFLVAADGTVDPASEEVLIEVDQMYDSLLHSNGDLAFGPDGFLYFGIGDGGFYEEVGFEAQDTSTLRGKISRIDVNVDPYAIPFDNPFVDEPGAAPEIYALGFRNPWRMAFDRDTGALWAGDVGHVDWEEVDEVVSGGNYGWPYREGSHCYPETACSGDFVEPVWDWEHFGGAAVAMGGVYRGLRLPHLDGYVVFADLVSGTVYGWTPAGTEVLFESGVTVVSAAEDDEGELLFVDHFGGDILRLEADPGSSEPVPALLSETGCVDPADPREPASGLLPYAINAPFWSDGAEKDRWIALPEGTKVHVGPDDQLEFPIGTVVVKRFTRDGLVIETRLLARHEDGNWGGYTYRWDETQTDATLVSEEEDLEVAWGDGAWIYPSRSSCARCHTGAAGHTLGTELVQIDRDFTYPSTGRTANQVTTWDGLGLFDAPVPAPADIEAIDDPYGPGSYKVTARAWLDTNCSMCHRPGHPAPTDMDLRHTTDIADMGICDVPPSHGDLGIADARILAPADPARSVLLERIRTLDPVHRMPPAGSLVVDTHGASVVESWNAWVKKCR